MNLHFLGNRDKSEDKNGAIATMAAQNVMLSIPSPEISYFPGIILDLRAGKACKTKFFPLRT